MAFAHVVLTSSRGHLCDTLAFQFIIVSFQFSLIYNKCLPSLQCESKSSPHPQKTFFAIFSLRLSIFPRNFAALLPVYIHTCLPILVYFS